MKSEDANHSSISSIWNCTSTFRLYIPNSLRVNLVFAIKFAFGMTDLGEKKYHTTLCSQVGNQIKETSFSFRNEQNLMARSSQNRKKKIIDFQPKSKENRYPNIIPRVFSGIRIQGKHFQGKLKSKYIITETKKHFHLNHDFKLYVRLFFCPSVLL